jgi:hypothetical protein
MGQADGFIEGLRNRGKLELIMSFYDTNLYYFTAAYSYDDKFNLAPNNVHVGEITKDVILKQTFTASYKGMLEIKILTANFARNNTCTVKLQLFDENNALLNETEVNAAELPNNEYYIYSFDKIDNSEGQLYTLVVSSPDGVSGNAATVWCTDKSSYDGVLYVNGIAGENNLCILPGYVFPEQ